MDTQQALRHGWQLLSQSDIDAIFHSLTHPRQSCAGPFHLEIDPIDVCNARCQFCNSQSYRSGETLDWEIVRRLLDDAAPRGLRSIRLAGGGEPLLYPALPDLIDWTATHNVRIDNVTTNGLRLSGALAESLARVAPYNLTVSLNFATAKNYSRVMGLPPERFHQVCENMIAWRQLAADAIDHRQSHFYTQFMITSETIADLPAMFELAARIGVTGIALRGLSDIPASQRLTEEERRRFYDTVFPLAREYKDRFLILFDMAMEGMQQEVDNITNEIYQTSSSAIPAEYDSYQFCMMPWYSLSVLGSGAVYPCCMLLGR